MASINEFETRTIIYLAIKHIDDFAIKGVSKYGDLEAKNKKTGEMILIEVKAAGTSGKDLAVEVSGAQIIDASIQLFKNKNSYDHRVVYCSGFPKKYDYIIRTNDPLSHIGVLQKISAFPQIHVLNRYDKEYENFLLTAWESTSGLQYLTLKSHQKKLIENELLTKGIIFNEDAFYLIEGLLKQDVQNGIIFNDKTLKIMFERTSSVSFSSIQDFATKNNVFDTLDEQNFEEAILNLNKEEISILAYRILGENDEGFILRLRNSIEFTKEWSIEKIIFISYISSKEEQWK